MKSSKHITVYVKMKCVPFYCTFVCQKVPESDETCQYSYLVTMCTCLRLSKAKSPVFSARPTSSSSRQQLLSSSYGLKRSDAELDRYKTIFFNFHASAPTPVVKATKLYMKDMKYIMFHYSIL